MTPTGYDTHEAFGHAPANMCHTGGLDMLAEANAILELQHGHVVMLRLFVIGWMVPHLLNLDLLLFRIGTPLIMKTGLN